MRRSKAICRESARNDFCLNQTDPLPGGRRPLSKQSFRNFCWPLRSTASRDQTWGFLTLRILRQRADELGADFLALPPHHLVGAVARGAPAAVKQQHEHVEHVDAVKLQPD